MKIIPEKGLALEVMYKGSAAKSPQTMCRRFISLKSFYLHFKVYSIRAIS
jgi:hypothetical protein